MKNITSDLQRQLLRHERLLRLANACHSLLEHEAWVCIQDQLTAERKEMLEQFVGQDLSEKQRDMLRAKIHVLDGFLKIPRLKAEKLSEYQRQVTHLRSALESRKNRELDREIPGWKEHVADIQSAFQGF